MVYIKKGGRGRTGDLKTQFNYQVKQLERRRVEEQAFIEARGGFSFAGLPKTLFVNLDYKTVYNKGITRKVGNKTVRYVGEQAVKMQIESIKTRASKTFQNQQFITNYINALKNIGMNSTYISKIEVKMNSLSADKLAIIIAGNALDSIDFFYHTQLNEDELFSRVMNALNYGVTKQEVKEIRQKRKLLIPLVREKHRVLRNANKKTKKA